MLTHNVVRLKGPSFKNLENLNNWFQSFWLRIASTCVCVCVSVCECVCAASYALEPGLVAKAVKVKAEHPDVLAFLLEARSDVSSLLHTPSLAIKSCLNSTTAVYYLRHASMENICVETTFTCST